MERAWWYQVAMRSTHQVSQASNEGDGGGKVDPWDGSGLPVVVVGDSDTRIMEAAAAAGDDVVVIVVLGKAALRWNIGTLGIHPWTDEGPTNRTNVAATSTHRQLRCNNTPGSRQH